MTTLSTFQTLPLHIAKTIAGHCIDTYRLKHVDIDHEKHIRQTWRAFYDVSNLWRAFTLRHYFKDLRVVVHPSSNTIVSFDHLPPFIEKRNHLYNYVKLLTLDLSSLGMEPYSVIANRYDEVWPKEITLTSASSLVICITLNSVNYTTVGRQVENEHIFRILQRVRASMPMLQEVRIDRSWNGDYRADHSENTTEPKLDSLFVDILKKAFNLRVCTWPSLRDGRDAQLLNGSLITSLSYMVFFDMEFFSAVLQRIGPTLESLDIINFPLESIKELVYDSDGRPIVYSRLKKLDFQAWCASDREITPIGLTTIPFPNLRYLKWMSEYPFKDDVLFRSANDTLEYLHIKSGTATLDVLEVYDVALMCRYTRLRHLSVETDPYLTSMESDLGQPLKIGASLITPETQTLVTNGNFSWQQVFSTFSTCPYAENIRVLSLNLTLLSLLEIFGLAKLLPNMTDFTCLFDTSSTDTHKRSNRTTMDRLYQEYYPLSLRLKCWETTGRLLRMNEVATAAITLAVLCPSFTFVAVPLEYVDEYHVKLKEAMENGEYCDYRDKIERLIYR